MLEAWIECPRKFKLMFIDEVPWQPSVEMQIGEQFHKFAQEFFEFLDYETLQTLRGQRATFDFFTLFVPLDLPSLSRQLCLNWLEFESKRWMICLDQFDDPIEYFKPLGTEVKIEVSERGLAGIVDRIDKFSERSLIVFEYKTSKQIHLPSVRRELAFYVLLLKASKLYSQPITHIGLINPRRKEFLIQPLTERLLKMTENRIKQLRRAIQIGIFPKRESLKCSWCMFAKQCVWEEGGEESEGEVGSKR